MPRCYDCLTEDVTLKVVDPYGLEHWFCAEDWAAHEKFSDAITAMLDKGIRDLAEQAAEREATGFTPPGLTRLLGK